ncbi:response regulator transcription factor [Franzmannia qiaohouensis]|uniref:Response regulator transcription factor n=1 Tax=Franzmannia qiaohouensis TaxID=1329370 RepID=A0ABU1HM22_9GAMM|nr:response regulator transcription factor [Halomonas qiaohouensis]MDR5907814.1 response regulator transcription factor [Halomonas qiaohouensis]
MKQHLFVCQGLDDIPRWKEAFPYLRRCTPQQARAQAGAGDHVWVVSQIEGWSGLVQTLSQRGAVLVVLAYSPSSVEAFQALNAGARGYAHAFSTAPLLQQIEVVTANQGIWVWPELLAQVVGSTFRALGGEARMRDDALGLLTERERAVALAVASGKSNKEVARDMDITDRTVKAHLGAVFRKLKVRDRMQLILLLSQRSETTSSA